MNVPVVASVDDVAVAGTVLRPLLLLLLFLL